MPRTRQDKRLLAATLLLSVGLSLGRPSQAASPAFSLSIQAGSAKTFEVPLSPDPFQDRSVVVKLSPVGSWPQPEELSVSLVKGRGEESGTAAGLLPFRPEGRLLYIRAQVSPCSPSREVGGVLEIWVAASQSEPASKLHELPFKVKVANSAEACSVTRGAPLLAGTATLALILYPWGMWLNSRFISPRQLANRLARQKKQWGADWQPDDEGAGVVRQAIERDLHPGWRALAWLRANPLRFGLPRGSYEECVRIRLNRDGSVSFELQPERCFRKNAERICRQSSGQLFAAAGEGELTFWGEPTSSGRICELDLDPGPSGVRWKKEVRLVYRRSSDQSESAGPSKAWKIVAR